MGCSSPSMLMTKLIGADFSVTASDGGGAVSILFGPSAVRDRRLVATMRQLAGEQCRRKPGVSTSADSFGASASSLNSPSPQRTAFESYTVAQPLTYA